MALRNQPYLPLYVQDFMTDEKVRELSAQSVGMYVFIMCILHKSETYGSILLKQKDKQHDDIVLNFAYKLARHLPYSIESIKLCLRELLLEKVLYIHLDSLCQKRMLKDGIISEKRSLAGRKGGQKSLGKANVLLNQTTQAKTQANSEYEYEYENEVIIDNTFEKSEKLLTKKEAEELLKLNKKKRVVVMPDLREFMAYAEKQLEDDFSTLEYSIGLKYRSWVENGWRTTGDKPRAIKNWKSTLLNTIPYLKTIKKPEIGQKSGAMAALMKKHKI